ncbi:DUF6503 family protein [Aureivirga marina]|uniref:DUF6503 family protein n=1 Tax=Aureivirga marina TaxID=1182451 RepID=UPI001E4EBE1B|nr:DUF6503 family protein [Aureivirga marina]
MKTNVIMLFVFGIFFISCKENKTKELTADEIVNKAIEKAGGERYDKINVEFTFRDKKYTAKRDNGIFEYSRFQKDFLGRTIEDRLTNNGFERRIENEVVEVPKKMAFAYSESVNSVIYFALLPYGLNDKAVHKKKLEDTTINSKKYHKIQVTFSQDGGGTDYEDVYIYYFDNQVFSVGYLSYSFKVNDGGARFRKAINSREINGIKFVDYLNYKPKNKTLDIQDFDVKFQKDELELVSEIKLENIVVK